MPSKSQLLKSIIAGRAHEAFTHEELGTFDITLMREVATRGGYELCHTSMVDADVKFLMLNRDWEPQRVWEIMIDPHAPWEIDPVMVILTPQGSHLLVDGIHRLIARRALLCEDWFFFMAPYEAAIRPPSMMFNRPDMGWGKYDVGRDGKLYNRADGSRFVGTKPNANKAR